MGSVKLKNRVARFVHYLISYKVPAKVIGDAVRYALETENRAGVELMLYANAVSDMLTEGDDK